MIELLYYISFIYFINIIWFIEGGVSTLSTSRWRKREKITVAKDLIARSRVGEPQELRYNLCNMSSSDAQLLTCHLHALYAVGNFLECYFSRKVRASMLRFHVDTERTEPAIICGS